MDPQLASAAPNSGQLDQEAVTSAAEAKLVVKLIAVGHGDAIALHWIPGTGSPSTILIDGGPKATDFALPEALKEVGAEAIDLMVLTHTDADHVDGLLQYAESPGRLSVKEYWGPCLPAFKRFAWLFPERVRRGLDQAEKLETALGAATRQRYPVETASWRSPDQGLTITVLSPAARLLERLLVADDALDLFLATPTPLGWLIDDRIEPPVEDRFEDVRAALRSGYLDPATTRAAPPPAGIDASHVESLHESDPEFFGNSVLNDTSIVVLVEARIGRATKRLLFTGDLENFTYLAFRHPLGLQCDVVKAPHHGSWSYLEKKEPALDEVWQWLRPKAVLTSAKGKHGLPRSQFRDAALRWGATLFCTCRRSREIVVGAPAEGCCYKQFDCGKAAQESVTLNITETGLVSEGVACGSGTRAGVIPVIQVRQHVVDPSAILDRFSEGELDRHVDWVRNELVRLHRERQATSVEHDPKLKGISSEILCRLAVAAGRFPVSPNIDLILNRAVAKGLVWSPKGWGGEREAYAIPSKTGWSQLVEWIDNYLTIQLATSADAVALTASEQLASADVSYLAARAAARFGFPQEMFADLLWPRLADHLRAGRKLVLLVKRGSALRIAFWSFGDAVELRRKLEGCDLDEVTALFESLRKYSSYEPRDFDWPTQLRDILAPPWQKGRLPAWSLKDSISALTSYHTRLTRETNIEILVSWATEGAVPLA